ncbi:MAG: metalloregulator ArsR/SmtB family transcription factor [Firmicutes bacterium]|nr:metalloregulator ArsR/SmtB family transcription factor [Bacillota bacterium]
MNSTYYADIFKVLADETRVKVIQILTTENRCACQILEAFKIGQSTLSHHMKLLTESGLVIAEKEGKWVYYRLNEEKFLALRAFFEKINAIDAPCINCGE